MLIDPSTIRPMTRRGGLIIALSTGLLSVFAPSASAAPLWPDSPQSPTAKVNFQLFLIVFVLGLIALVAYMGSMRAAARADAAADGESSAKGALIGGLVVFLILSVIGWASFAKASSADGSLAQSGLDQKLFKVTTFSRPGLKVAHVVKAPSGPAYSIKVNAQQYLWRYEYPGLDTRWNTYSYNELVLPAGVTVLLDFASSDVEAAWWAPQIGGSVSAIPGYANKSWVRADKPGTYEGAGTVVNGSNYASMTTKIRVLPVADFQRWVLGKQAEIDKAMNELAKEVEDGEVSGLVAGTDKKAPSSSGMMGGDQPGMMGGDQGMAK